MQKIFLNDYGKELLNRPKEIKEKETLYSEEEVIRFADWILHKRFEMRNDNHQNWWGKFNEEKDYTSKELFEQFKKK